MASASSLARKEFQRRVPSLNLETCQYSLSTEDTSLKYRPAAILQQIPQDKIDDGMCDVTTGESAKLKGSVRHKPTIDCKNKSPGKPQETPSSRKRFSRMIQKYWADLTSPSQPEIKLDRHVKTEKQRTPRLDLQSCPNLPNEIIGSSLAVPPPSPSSFSDCGSYSNPKMLTVPDLFTTSLTHSPSQKTSRTRQLSRTATLPETMTCGSAPNLAQSSLEDGDAIIPRKANLTKSYSDTPPLMQMHRTTSLSHDMYRTDLHSEAKISKVHDFLYVGNVQAAQNQRLICKLSICSIIDLNNSVEADHVSSATAAMEKSIIPCTCNNSRHQSPAALRLQVADDDFQELEDLMLQINRFICGARIKGKAVLVFSHCGISLAVLVVMQHLITFCGFTLHKAYSAVMRCSVGELPQSYKQWLEKMHNQADVHVNLPKPAWAEI